MGFERFELHAQLLENIKQMGFSEPSPIQAEVFPIALEGKDVSGLARTGTGKTAAFLIPTIHRLMNLPPERIALVLAPTRELALQIQQEAEKLAKDMGLGTACVVGGMSAEDQGRDIQGGARIITGTPGRVIDLFKERVLDLQRVEMLIFDEADRMFDMGFIKDMSFLLGKVYPQRQILLFSATLNYSVLNMVYEFNANPVEINISRDRMTAEGIRQVLYQVGDEEKPNALVLACKQYAAESGAIIVFVNYKERAPWVADILTRNGFSARALSSLMSQDKRNHIIQGFKQGKFRALVATDVASRGIDVEGVELVANFHLPEDSATYVHRIGRTARAGKTGIAVSIASSEDAYNQMRVEEFLGQKIPVEWFNDEDLKKPIDLPPRYSREEEDGGEGQAPRRHTRGNDRGGPRRGNDRHARGGDRGPSRAPREHREPREARTTEETREPRPAPVAEAHRDARPERTARPARTERPHREHRERAPLEKVALPSPLTGNPVIYNTSTGKIKNRSEAEIASLSAPRKIRKGSNSSAKPGNLMKKISSKVTALFASKK